MSEGTVRRGARHRRAGSALAIFLPIVAGCGGGEAPVADLGCPEPAIVAELASFERYRDGSDRGLPADLAWSAALQNIRGTCGRDGSDLAITLTVETMVGAGPAFAGEAVELPYFVAVSDPAGNVVDRADYVARVGLAAGQRSGGTVETLSQRFAGAGAVGDGAAGAGAAGYRILLGFALPREEALRRQPAG